MFIYREFREFANLSSFSSYSYFGEKRNCALDAMAPLAIGKDAYPDGLAKF
jgi:hypothetical protein